MMYCKNLFNAIYKVTGYAANLDELNSIVNAYLIDLKFDSDKKYIYYKPTIEVSLVNSVGWAHAQTPRRTCVLHLTSVRLESKKYLIKVDNLRLMKYWLKIYNLNDDRFPRHKILANIKFYCKLE